MRQPRKEQSKDDLSGYTAKIRVSYSRSASEVRIDITTALCADEKAKNRETFRSRRITPLTLKTIPSVVDEDLVQACTGLGILGTAGWQEEELEALQRLWTSRDEWRRYDAC